MKEGQLRPERTVINPATGLRNATVFPEERPGQDRIIDQLMFVPPKVKLLNLLGIKRTVKNIEILV